VKRQILQRTKDAINQSSINQKDVRSFLIMLPPKGEQQRFSQQTQGIENLVAQQSLHAASLDALFASLQHRAFRGEL
jgi:type I restriction enzyme S subunit